LAHGGGGTEGGNTRFEVGKLAGKLSRDSHRIRA